MRKDVIKEKKEFFVGVVVGLILLSIVIIPHIVQFFKPFFRPKPVYYLAIADSFTDWDNDGSSGNETFMKGGSTHAIYLKFDLTNIPKKYDSVEVSVYIFEFQAFDGGFRGVGDLAIIESNWNESMTATELNHAFSQIMPLTDDLYARIGLQSISIPISAINGETLSLRLTAGLGGSGEVSIYSKEAVVPMEYKPQLIFL